MALHYKVIGKFHGFRYSVETPGQLVQVHFKRTNLIVDPADKIPGKLAFQYMMPHNQKPTQLIKDLKYWNDCRKEVELYLVDGKDATLHITNIKEFKDSVEKDIKGKVN